MRVLCKNGNTVERFYDRSSRSSVTRVLDADGNQIGDAEFDGNKASAKCSWNRLVRDNGGSGGPNKKGRR